MSRLLVIDVNNLMARTFFALPAMPAGGRWTGAIHGFLKVLLAVRRDHDVGAAVFCFDGAGEPVRREVYPPYKMRAEAKISQPYGAKEKKHLKAQLAELRDEVLPKLGFRNVFMADGYEADDVIAHVAARRDCLIVSSDRDLYQCLRAGVDIYDPGRKAVYTAADFEGEYGVGSERWAEIKAIMGDPGDGVPGIDKIGVHYATKWIRGELKATTVAGKAIVAGAAVAARNLKLVKLPYPGLKVPGLRPDCEAEKKWRSVLEAFGVRTAGAL